MRVHLSRIIAINWYGYRDFIDVSGLTLITGANGSGKSALLDLLQFVMLGESLSRFNKAAAGAGSGRTLRGYCLCDTNTVGKDGQERFLRPSGVTLAALEFVWPAGSDGSEPRHETWGARIEYEGPTAKPRTLWFCVPGRLQKDDFLAPQLLDDGLSFLSEDEFRVHVKRDLEGDVWDRQATYLEEMASRNHLGFDRVQMNKTLPNSMAFQPVESFEKFIREYLLEPGLPDVKAVRASVDAHRRAKDRLDTMHDQHQRLVRICEQHATYLETKREAALFGHLRDALVHEEKKEALEARRAKIEQLRQQNEEQRADHDAAITERNDLEQQLASVRLVAGNDSQIAHLAQNRSRFDEVQKEIEQLREASKTARQYLHDRTQHWKQWLKHAGELGIEEPDRAASWLKEMQGADEAPALDAATRMARIYHELASEGDDQLRPIEERIKELEARESRLKREIDDLVHKGSTAASPLLDALRSRGQKAVALGRVIEVKPEAEPWWPLLETLLGPNRQAVLPEDFTAAWDQAQRLGHIDEPLVDPSEVSAGKAKKGSVAEFFETSHGTAKAYLEQLYGDLVAVDKAKQLDKHPRALSKDGWLKDPPLRLHLTPSKEFTIGEEGLRRLRTLREEELEVVGEELTKLNRSRDDWKMWLHRGKQWNLDQADPPAGTSGLRDLPRLKKESQQLDETIRLLATPEREATVEKLRVLDKTFQGVIERIGRLAGSLSKFEQQEREQLDAIASATEEEETALQERRISREKVSHIRDTEIASNIESVLEQFAKWSQRIEAVGEVARTRRSDSEKARDHRDIERRALAEKHPDTAEFFDPADDENTRYDNRRRELEEHELERYRVEAEDAQRQWEDRLQHQVLDVLKEKLDEAERTKKELNKAMDHVIGGMRYQLSMRADRTHSAIWTLVDKGLNPSLELFAAGGKEDIEKAKQALMLAIENAEDPRHQKALDYRYYHHWDIQATPAGKGEGSAISLNKSAKKQSGGENQAPFFVAMLAAFQRVYDLGRKDLRRNLGLVVMDEAFSKLSGDRIDACLALARNFGLQLVMAFPEDRLPTMIQHAQTVVQARVERTYEEKTGNVTGIRNWCARVDRKRLIEALS
ncbi:SbcC/MukB-like Walker B domain-containing protein [Luteolibacter luteus]|uniref:AAA family ATPase n=1 Tax=Luteolibacter luteus TaxID=2728835 RepID=A0A858RK99_9BACT|nr:SbcC/MukB-like Walker B domain-containing protein [Luteolibacter luteus]QJE97282.1 AAA family ATPase [Luteolibacter luteus]